MTNITQENTSIMAESVNYTRLYKNVAKNTDLNWSEKAILSLIITAQVNGRTFVLTDLELSKLLDIDAGNINKYISLLAKRNIIYKTTASIPSHSGGKPKRRRTITVLNLDTWTHDNKKPVFTPINVIKKKNAKSPAKRKSPKNPIEALTDVLTPTTKPSTENSVNVSKIENKESILEANEVVVVDIDLVDIEDVEEEDNDVLAIDYAVDTSNILTIHFDEVNSRDKILNAIREKIQEGIEVKYFDVIVEFGDDIEESLDTVCFVNDPINPKMKYARKALIENIEN